MAEKDSSKKLTGSIIAVILLAVCLCITTFALARESISAENNIFHTGEIKINLNNGNPLIRENEFIFEPGMTVKKDFFIENNSSQNVFYKLYLNNISGGLSNVITVTIKSGDRIIYTGVPAELTIKDVFAADDILKIGQRQYLTAFFHYPETSGNTTQDSDLSFTLCAEATQVKNNPNRLFNNQ